MVVRRRRPLGAKKTTTIVTMSLDSDLLKALDVLGEHLRLARSTLLEKLVRLGLRLIAVDYEGEVKEA